MINLKFYKVVLNDGGVLKSCTVYNTEIEEIYPPREWVQPPNGPSLVFRTLSGAKSFVLEMMRPHRFEIWSCEGVNPRAAIFAKSIRDPLYARNFWKSSYSQCRTPRHAQCSFPDDTKIHVQLDGDWFTLVAKSGLA